MAGRVAQPCLQPWIVVADGIVIAVRLTARGGRDAIEGFEQRAGGSNVVKARVRAAPSGGEANSALLRLMASALEVPLRQVSLIAGITARIKRLKIGGDGEVLAAALKRHASEPKSSRA